MPKGDVPGEWYSPTQPFPTKPPAYARQGVSINELIDFTPELRAQAEKLVSQFKLGPMYTPPVVSKQGGPLATLTLPSPAGGTNWPGAAYDPGDAHGVCVCAGHDHSIGPGEAAGQEVYRYGFRVGARRRGVPALPAGRE